MPEGMTVGSIKDMNVAQIKGRHVTAIARQGRFREITTTAGMPSPIGSFDSPRSETLVLPAPPSALNRSPGESAVRSLSVWIEASVSRVAEKALSEIGTVCALSSRRRAVTTISRSEEHTSELQSLMRISYAVFCLKKKNKTK